MLDQLIGLGVSQDNIYLIRPIEYEINKFYSSFEYEMFDKRKLSQTEIQRVLFDMLVNFRDICDKNGLNYCLYDGTLIGALRHKGFIPWDDDIDVAMPYEDYLKLCDCIKNEDTRYPLLSWDRDENYEWLLVRMVDDYTRIAIPEHTVIGAFLDIFLLCGYPDNQEEVEAKWDESVKAHKEWYAYYILRDTSVAPKDYRRALFNDLYNKKFSQTIP